MQARKGNAINDIAILFHCGTIMPHLFKVWNATGTKCDRITYLYRFRFCSPLDVDSNHGVVPYLPPETLVAAKTRAKRLIYRGIQMTEFLREQVHDCSRFVRKWNPPRTNSARITDTSVFMICSAPDVDNTGKKFPIFTVYECREACRPKKVG